MLWRPLNAARLTRVSVLSDRRNEPKKIPSFPFKNLSNSANFSTIPSSSVEGLSRNVHGGLVLLSSVFTTSLAKALTYEEALQQSTTSASAADFDANAFVETLTNFVSESPLVIVGGVAAKSINVNRCYQNTAGVLAQFHHHRNRIQCNLLVHKANL